MRGCDEASGSIDANFNGVINDDGSFVGLWRTWECSGDLCPENGYATYGTSTDLEGGQACFSVPHPVVASDWPTVSTYRYSINTPPARASARRPGEEAAQWLFGSEYTVTQAAKGIEDPMVYKDANGVYHAIFHDMFEKCSAARSAGRRRAPKAPRDNVAHAYSTDGISWIYTGAALPLVDQGESYMPEVSFTDGTKMGLACERPQFVVENGVPTAIIIGGIPKARTRPRGRVSERRRLRQPPRVRRRDDGARRRRPVAGSVDRRRRRLSLAAHRVPGGGRVAAAARVAAPSPPPPSDSEGEPTRTRAAGLQRVGRGRGPRRRAASFSDAVIGVGHERRGAAAADAPVDRVR